MTRLRHAFRRFLRREEGSMTIHGLFLFATCCAIGAAGLDVTHFYAARTQLQSAADLAAHAALYQRYQKRSAAEARSDAIDAVQYGMPSDVYGDVIQESDITFGTYDAKTRVFTPVDPGTKPTAVEVIASRAEDNPVGSFLFRIVGVDEVDVRARSVFVAVGDPCADMQGLFANGEVAPNSNNTYSAGFCLHSNSGIPLRNNNSFDVDSSVSAPSLSDIGCSGNAGNIDSHCPNLTKVWRAATYDLNARLDPLRAPASPATETSADLLADVRAAMPAWNWSGIDQGIDPGVWPNKKSDPIPPGSVEGQVVYFDCRSGGGSANLSGTYRKTVLLLHGCEASMQNAVFQDSIVYTTNTDNKNSIAIRGSGSLQIGTDDDCDGTGSAAILTRGGYDSPSNLTFRGGTVLALGDVKFAAHGSGKGMSIIAGGGINPTSNNTFTACPPSDGSTPSLVTFTLAQ